MLEIDDADQGIVEDGFVLRQQSAGLLFLLPQFPFCFCSFETDGGQTCNKFDDLNLVLDGGPRRSIVDRERAQHLARGRDDRL